jgi:hypothetical protein
VFVKEGRAFVHPKLNLYIQKEPRTISCYRPKGVYVVDIKGGDILLCIQYVDGQK